MWHNFVFCFRLGAHNRSLASEWFSMLSMSGNASQMREPTALRRNVDQAQSLQFAILQRFTYEYFCIGHEQSIPTSRWRSLLFYCCVGVAPGASRCVSIYTCVKSKLQPCLFLHTRFFAPQRPFHILCLSSLERFEIPPQLRC